MTVPIVVAAGAVIRRDDEILLIRRARDPEAGRWSVPGGRVEPGESLRDAVHREVREEVGLVAEVGALVGVVERRGPAHHILVADFVATVDANATPVAGDDAEAWAWVRLDELGEWDLVEGLGDFFAEHGIV